MDEREKVRVPALDPSLLQKKAVLIQKNFRTFLAKKRFQLLLSQKRKKGAISEFGRRYIVELNFTYLAVILYDNRFKSILIKIVKKPADQIALENKQKLYEHYDYNDLRQYCLQMLAEVKDFHI